MIIEFEKDAAASAAAEAGLEACKGIRSFDGRKVMRIKYSR